MIERKFTFKCDICGSEHTHSETVDHTRGSDGNLMWLPSVRLPDGWKWLGCSMLLCEKHSIRVDDECVWEGAK